MPYLKLLVAGYRAGLASPSVECLQLARSALRVAADPVERGRCLGTIAALLVRDDATDTF